MNQPTNSTPTVNGPATSQKPLSPPLDRHAVAQALAAVRADSQRQPETYLRDTVVPHGGE